MKDVEAVISLYFDEDDNFVLNLTDEGYNEHYDNTYEDAMYGPYGNK